MLRKSLSLVCVAVILCAGCAKNAPHRAGTASVDRAETDVTTRLVSREQNQSVGFDSFSPVAMRTAGMGGGGYGTVFAASHFVAVRHKLEIIEPGSNLPKSLDAVLSFCGTIQCEVLSSNITNETSVLSAAANITARVAPQDLNKFLDFVGKQGKISQHATESEDKTAAVVDVEAKIKNQTDFRDSLRRMLVKPGVSVADLLQIQEKLAEAQAELDSEATQRKVLANETEKVYIEIAFRSERHTTRRGAFASVGDAFGEFGSDLADSLVALITAIAAIIPWLIVIVPGVWILVRFVRNLRRKRAERKASLANSQG